MALVAQAFGSPELMQSLRRARRQPAVAAPRRGLGGSEQFDGEQGLGLGDGTGVLQDLADLDELAEQLSQSYGGARMDDIDLDKLARQLGDEAAVDARTLQRARAGAARHRLPQARLRRAAPALARGDAPARQGAAQGRGRPDVRPPGPARPAPGRRCRGAHRRDPGVDVRRHRAVGRDPHGHQRRASAPSPRAATPGRRPPRRSATSRSPRPRPAPRRASRCWSTRRSRWRWTAAGCR